VGHALHRHPRDLVGRDPTTTGRAAPRRPRGCAPSGHRGTQAANGRRRPERRRRDDAARRGRHGRERQRNDGGRREVNKPPSCVPSHPVSRSCAAVGSCSLTFCPFSSPRSLQTYSVVRRRAQPRLNRFVWTQKGALPYVLSEPEVVLRLEVCLPQREECSRRASPTRKSCVRARMLLIPSPQRKRRQYVRRRIIVFIFLFFLLFLSTKRSSCILLFFVEDEEELVSS